MIWDELVAEHGDPTVELCGSEGTEALADFVAWVAEVVAEEPCT